MTTRKRCGEPRKRTGTTPAQSARQILPYLMKSIFSPSTRATSCFTRSSSLFRAPSRALYTSSCMAKPGAADLKQASERMVARSERVACERAGKKRRKAAAGGISESTPQVCSPAHAFVLSSL